jgi:GTP-binding protein
LGVVDLGDFRTFVVADIPGLIEGAHKGAGLGDRFLRHIERTKLLLHLVDVSSFSERDPVNDYETINRELAAYDDRLAAAPQIVVATKMDALDDPERLAKLEARVAADGRSLFAISSVTQTGVREVVVAASRALDEIKARAMEAQLLTLEDASIRRSA